MVTENEYKGDEKAKKTLYISAGIFIFVLVLNIGLYFYNSYIEYQNNDYTQTISRLDQDIKRINEDPSIKLYTLLNANKVYLEKYKYLSQVPEFINNIKALEKTYNMKFNGFSYADGIVSSSVDANDDEVSLGSTKAEKFIEYFRKQNKDIFSLKFVNAFDGQTDLKFNVNFLVK